MSQQTADVRPGALGTVAFGLTALTILAAQIVLSRFFAATLTYYYAFMLISLAMLGLAGGGLWVRLASGFFTPERAWTQAAGLSAAMGVTLFAGVLAALRIYPHVQFGGAMNFYTRDYWALAGIFWCFFPAFLFGGTVVSLVLGHARRSFHTLYAVDLCFAAAGCVLAVILLTARTPVQTLLQSLAVLPLLAATLFWMRAGRLKTALGSLGLALAIALAGGLLGQVREIAKPPHRSWLSRPELLSEWNASSAIRVFPIDFLTWSLSPTYAGPGFHMLDMLIDGVGGTQIVAFDGRVESLRDYEYLAHDLPALGQMLTPEAGRQLIIGPGGGVDILQALRYGRRDVTAVEINPLVARVVNDDLGGFSGRPYYLPGVRVFIENGRTFVKRSRESWDLVSLTWVDTGGSATALAFSENFLYTVEAYQEFLRRLTPDGMLSYLRAYGVNEAVRVDSVRGIAVAMEALRREGVLDPARHVLVAASNSPFFNRVMCSVLIKRSPFTPAEIETARGYLASHQFQAIWLPDGTPDLGSIPSPYEGLAPLVRDLVTTLEPAAVYRTATLDVAPATDDNPFYFVERAGARRPAGLGVRELGTYVTILATLVVPFLLLPLLPTLRRGGRLGFAGVSALTYFSLLGIAYMLVEIEFFHLFALLLGSPTLTLGTVLGALLVGSGLGSLQAARVARAGAVPVAAAFVVLCALLAAFALGGHALLELLVRHSLSERVLGTILVIGPIAFAMGLPMAIGMAHLQDRGDVTLWGWALNGAFSVFASVAALYFAIHWGIAATFAVGTACYLVAGVLIQYLYRHPLDTDSAVAL